MSTPRAVIFIDGNNLFHSLQDAKVEHRMELDYAKISYKIIAARAWLGTRYYIGVLPQQFNPQRYEDQRRFLSRLENTSSLISVHRGRMEVRHPEKTDAVDLRQVVSGMRSEIPAKPWEDLMSTPSTRAKRRCSLKRRSISISQSTCSRWR